ncbi:formate dehydrogenase subunit gamma [Rubrimonas cliftonensis]|uniref:Formate dehydrogenase gamma subunit n=1 Tax=Rubrimonas cliftonensis TaxID=89524 RepID=A0A1H4D3D7_9RHOB|nr:formate dehydrogenase subunit gamma [Rubrimonas cliftonensis]SEA66959.1 formate dehydrogenase gamma subunit [Rubrimonas cliftonensis]
MRFGRNGSWAGALALALALATAALWTAPEASAQSSVRPPSNAVTNTPSEPGSAIPFDGLPSGGADPAARYEGALAPRGAASDSEMWRAVRQGETFTSQKGGAMGARLIQTEAAGWDILRNRLLPKWSLWAIGGVLALLAVFYLVRGKIRVDAGMSGREIERFKAIERFGHWLLAGSFIILALSGLNILVGRDLLLPLIGKEAFTTLTIAGKWAHNNVAWAFMLALAMTFVLWVAHNIPGKTDLKWIAVGGGLLVKGVHPPARKFNFGQKLIFWSVMILGASVSASGVALLFPFETSMFGSTFAKVHAFGLAEPLASIGLVVPASVTPMAEQQFALVWHAIVAIAMIVIIIAHIYIGSIGMQGAFAAMGSGWVDENWAREHHGLWVEEEREKAREGRGARGAAGVPAE